MDAAGKPVHTCKMHFWPQTLPGIPETVPGPGEHPDCGLVFRRSTFPFSIDGMLCSLQVQNQDGPAAWGVLLSSGSLLPSGIK